MADDTEDYTEAVIIKGSDGTSLITLLTDSSGRLVGVLKGEYNGSLETIKLDSGGRMLGRMMPAIETVIRGKNTNTFPPSGYGQTNSGYVPANKRWKITNMTMYNNTGKSSEMSMWLQTETEYYLVNHMYDIPPAFVLEWDGEIWLDATDRLYFYWEGGVLGDILYAYWNGSEYSAEY